jgi:hypothetical protein
LYINFIDFKAAFDLINWDFIWKAFQHYGLPTKYINVFKAFFREIESAVHVNGDLTRWFDVESGTGQGDVQRPPIFHLVVNWGLELAERLGSRTYHMVSLYSTGKAQDSQKSVSLI